MSNIQSFLDYTDKVQPMSAAISRIFLIILTETPQAMVDEIFELLPATRILANRIPKESSEKIDREVVAFCGCLCESPGDSVMWAYTLHLLSKKYTRVTISVLAEEFPEGFPTKEARELVWESQKRPGQRPDNWLDYAETWA